MNLDSQRNPFTAPEHPGQDDPGVGFQVGGRSDASQSFSEAQLLEDSSIPLSSHDSGGLDEGGSISPADSIAPAPAAAPTLKELKKKAFLKKSKTWGFAFVLIAIVAIVLVAVFTSTWKTRLAKKVGAIPAAVQAKGDANSVGNAAGGGDNQKLLGAASEKPGSNAATSSDPNTPEQPPPLKPGAASGPAQAGAQPGSGKVIPPVAAQYDAQGRPILPEVPVNRFDAPMGVQSGRQPSSSSAASSTSPSAGSSGVQTPNFGFANPFAQLTSGANGAGAPSQAPPAGGSFGGNLTSAKTPKAFASLIGNRSLILAQGVDIPCVLDTAISSELPSMPRCHAPKDIYSDDGKVVLAEAGTTFNGESGAVAMKNGQNRMYVLWSRLKTPLGVTVALDSPGADALGRGGLGGDVDKRWGERIGSAFLLSVVQDAIAYATTRGGNQYGPGVYQNTTNTGNQMATEVLKDSISIPPRLTLNQGEIISIHVARDIDFSTVYQLQAK